MLKSLMKRLSVFLPAMAMALAAQTPQYPNYPSETPAKSEMVTSSFDYTRRDVMIPMRDGVKLHATSNCLLLDHDAQGAVIQDLWPC